jgi:ElaB/YqjD/DUF883 family membrane-anchored ribosome-binding protein
MTTPNGHAAGPTGHVKTNAKRTGAASRRVTSRPPSRSGEPHVEDVKAAAKHAFAEPLTRLTDARRAIEESFRERPAFGLAVALGVGFVIGGALSSRAGRWALGVGARHALREMLASET